MYLPKIGMITFSDPREHEFHVLYEEKTEVRMKTAKEYLEKLPVEIYAFDIPARSAKEIDEQTNALKGKGIEVFIAHIPCWTWPNGVVRGVLNMGLPTVLLSNDDPSTHGTVGLLGAGGALNQIGYKHLRIQQDFTEEHPNLIDTKLLPFVRAASAVERLKGQVFGFIGGRSLGIDTGSFDPMQWKKLFAIDSDHIDHEEIIRRAEQIDPQRIDATYQWLVDSVGEVKYDEKLTEERLKYQVACYLATKDIIADRKLDFGAIKCMPDLTNFRAPQCISTALLNGGYDADGNFEPFPISCEADADGALSMEILKLVSGGMPTMFADVSHIGYKEKLIYLPNCGSMCTYYAGRHCEGCKNMKNIELRRANRPSGGAVTFTVPSAGEMTMARLCRTNGKYQMFIIETEFVEPSKEIMDAFVKARGVHQLPVAFMKADFDIEKFMDVFNSNHISGVAGRYKKELLEVCRLLDIEPVVVGE